MLLSLPRLAAFAALAFSSLPLPASGASASLGVDTPLALEPALSAFFPNPNGLTYSYTASPDFLCPPDLLIIVDAVFPVRVDVVAEKGFDATGLRRLSDEEPEVLALIANNWTSTAVRWTFPPMGENRVIARVLDAANNVVHVPRRLIPPKEGDWRGCADTRTPEYYKKQTRETLTNFFLFSPVVAGAILVVYRQMQLDRQKEQRSDRSVEAHEEEGREMHTRHNADFREQGELCSSTVRRHCL